MFAFHILIACLEPSKKYENPLILAFAFLSRAMRLPTAEYEAIPDEIIERASIILSECHEKAFGPTAGTYNYHIVGSHLKFIREQIGPFTDMNAYIFESSYGDMRRSYMVGTRKPIYIYIYIYFILFYFISAAEIIQ